MDKERQELWAMVIGILVLAMPVTYLAFKPRYTIYTITVKVFQADLISGGTLDMTMVRTYGEGTFISMGDHVAELRSGYTYLLEVQEDEWVKGRVDIIRIVEVWPP